MSDSFTHHLVQIDKTVFVLATWCGNRTFELWSLAAGQLVTEPDCVNGSLPSMTSYFSTKLHNHILSIFVKMADFAIVDPFPELGGLAEA